jgi:hypothetical protein
MSDNSNVKRILGTVAWSSGFPKSCSSRCCKRGLISKHTIYKAFIMQQKHRLGANTSPMYPLVDSEPTRHNALAIGRALGKRGMYGTLNCNEKQ